MHTVLHSYFFYAVICILLTPSIMSIGEAGRCIKNNSNMGYIVEYKSDTIKTGNNLKFVGKTEDYLFLYNVKEKESIIIKNSNVGEIRIKERKNK